jgi:hypothetical protein
MISRYAVRWDMVREVLALVEGLFGYTGLRLSRCVDTVRSRHESFPFELTPNSALLNRCFRRGRHSNILILLIDQLK